MNNQLNNQLNNQFNNPITEDDIANYLGNTPDFFERHAELLAAVHLSSPHSNRACRSARQKCCVKKSRRSSIESWT